MFSTFDKIKKHTANVGASIIKNIKTNNIKPCDGVSYEYSSNDDDYNEFLKNVGSTQQDYVNIPNPNDTAEDVVKNTATEPEQHAEKKDDTTIKKTIDNISDTIFDKFNQIKNSIETNKTPSNTEELTLLNDISNNQVNVSLEIKNLSDNLNSLSVDLLSIKEHIDEIEKSSKSTSAELSFAVEKLSQDIASISAYISDSGNKMSDLENTVNLQTAEFEKMKSEYILLNKVITGLSSDLSDVSANQQMSKNSILALAESFDSLSKKITIGFITIGVISALSVIVQIVFNIL